MGMPEKMYPIGSARQILPDLYQRKRIFVCEDVRGATSEASCACGLENWPMNSRVLIIFNSLLNIEVNFGGDLCLPDLISFSHLIKIVYRNFIH